MKTKMGGSMGLKPLPSDEEIQTEATIRAIAAACSTDEEIDADMEFGFITGAKWLRSQCPDVAKLSADLEVMKEAWKWMRAHTSFQLTDLILKADAIAGGKS
jgi:hypothetical protein